MLCSTCTNVVFKSDGGVMSSQGSLRSTCTNVVFKSWIQPISATNLEKGIEDNCSKI